MKKIILVSLILFTLTVFSGAEVSFIQVTGSDEYTRAGDFDKHTYSIKVAGSSAGGACQAVRIHRNYFLTAAHCVADFCQKGSCTVWVSLSENKKYEAMAELKHSSKNKTIFLNKEYSGLFGESGIDIAVLKYVPSRVPFYFLEKKTNKLYPREVLEQMGDPQTHLNRAARSRHNAAPDFPLIYFSNEYYRLNRVLSFLSIDGSQKSVKLSADYERDSDGDKNPAYFLKDLRAVFVQNFGSYKGMSGSGIMTNTGELLGINSSISEYEYYENGKKKKVSYSGFATLNDKTVDTLKSAMGAAYDKLSIIDAETCCAKEISHNKIPLHLKHYQARLKKQDEASKEKKKTRSPA